jgi:hypothetical protein
MLWPGDWWVPAINYPFEGATSMECGRRLAAWIRRFCTTAASLSFASHSLGARLVLEAAKNLDRRARAVCLTAGAINDDCLIAEYAAAAASTAVVSVLASRDDYVLKLAFRIGDPIADLLHDDHAFFRAALGSRGPAAPVPSNVAPPWQIDDSANYGHGDYLPPGDRIEPVGTLPQPRWIKPAKFMARAFRGEAQTWPESLAVPAGRVAPRLLLLASA